MDVATQQSWGVARSIPSPHLLCEWDCYPDPEKKLCFKDIHSSHNWQQNDFKDGYVTYADKLPGPTTTSSPSPLEHIHPNRILPLLVLSATFWGTYLLWRNKCCRYLKCYHMFRGGSPNSCYKKWTNNSFTWCLPWNKLVLSSTFFEETVFSSQKTTMSLKEELFS